MIEILRRRRNESELGKVHPAFRDRFERLVKAMSAHGRPRLQDTWRDEEAQRAKFKAGLSQISGIGPHTSTLIVGGKVRPASLAIHVLDDDAPLKPSPLWVARLAVLAEDFGLRTGALWADREYSPFALGTQLRILGESMVTVGNVEGLVDLFKEYGFGFDPLHCEVVGWRRFHSRMEIR